MPTLRSKQAEPAPIREALVGAAYKINGVLYVVRSGERLRADHPMVRKYPAMFAADGLSDSERSAAHMQYREWKDAKAAGR